VSFGDNVRWLRKKQGLSQSQLAARIRVRRRIPHVSMISRIELGKSEPRLSIVRSIAAALGVKPWQLMVELGENAEFWRGYLDLSPAQKREIQRLIRYYLEK